MRKLSNDIQTPYSEFSFYDTNKKLTCNLWNLKLYILEFSISIWKILDLIFSNFSFHTR